MRIAGQLSGHVDDWEELAVDYLDGTLDAETTAAIEQHLAVCPACAARLQGQRNVLALLQETPLEEAPLGLEYQILSEAPAPFEAPPMPVRRPGDAASGWSRIWQRKIRPWIPATVGVVAVLIAVVGYGLLREDGDEQAVQLEATTTVVAYTASETPADNSSREENVGATLTTSAAVSTTAAPTDTTTADAATTTAPAGTETTAAPRPGGETAQVAAAGADDRNAMIAGLEDSQTPVYFHFQTEAKDDVGITETTAVSVIDQIVALTGLRPLAENLSLGGPTFAAFVPREDAEQFIDLLQSIGTTAQLTVVLEMEPPEPATDAVDRLMEKKRDFPILYAQRTPPPAVSDYSFTTSTSADPAEGQESGDTETLPPDEAGTHVMVVIFIR